MSHQSPSGAGRALPADVHRETLSRLSPIRREALTEEQRVFYDALTSRQGLNLAGLQGPGGVWLRVPKLRNPMGDLNRILRSGCGLDPRLVEVAILATAREMHNQFEWTMHEPEAIRTGVPPAIIDAIKSRKPVAGLSEAEAVLIELARGAIGAKHVSEATYTRALEVFGEELLICFSALIGTYALTAIVLSVFDQQLQEGQDPLLPVF